LKFTVDESQIEKSVYIDSTNWGINESKLPLRLKQNLILLPLLPPLLSRVSNDFASGNAFKSLLRIVHKYPLLEEDYSESDELSLLYQQAIAAADKYLGPYSRVSVRFYTMRITLIQIPNCRNAARG